MKLYSVLILVFAVTYLNAQQPASKNKVKFGIIIGNLVNQSNNNAVEFAKVTLYSLSDSLQYAIITDKNGSFEFNALSFGYYSLRASAMSLADIRIDSIYLRADRYDFNLGDVKLKEASSALVDIIVYSEKPLLENKDDQLIYNVGESALSAGSSTADLLKNIPLINNDPTGKILLKGREPKILIDDKPTDLTPQQLQDLLESLPGSSIEKIEIMTNPPPQYATETGGVINIVTKKGKIGWVGRMNLSAGSRGDASFSSNISYRNKKISFNQTIGFGTSKLLGNSSSTRENKYADSVNFFKTAGHFLNQNSRPNWRSQIDYELNSKNLIGLVYQSNFNFYNNFSSNVYSNFNQLNQLYKLSIRDNTSIGNGYNHGITLSYIHKGKNIAEVLRFFLIGNFNKNDNDRDFYQQFLNLGFISTGIDSTQTQYFNVFSHSASAKIDYVKPFTKKGNSISGGLNYFSSNYHNLLNTHFLRKVDSIMVPNDLLSNEFTFYQYIFTSRVGISILITPSIRLTTGAQIEQTQMNFDIVKSNVGNVSNQYVNFLPNATIRKEFNKYVSTSWVYRATIKRPGIGELNPNIDYSDPYNLRFGNPYLLPTLSHNFDWNFNYNMGKYYINTSLGYNQVTNIFNSIRTLIDGGKTAITWLNIANRQEFEASAYGGFTFSKEFRMNGSIGYTYNKYSEYEKQTYLYINGGSFYTSINYRFTPTNVLNFEGSARYSNFASPQGSSRSNISMNIGVQRKFFNRRLIVSLNIIDPITPQQYVTVTSGNRFYIESVHANTTRNYRISISYQLNKLVQKSSLNNKIKSN